jgi:hypothetical protein
MHVKHCDQKSKTNMSCPLNSDRGGEQPLIVNDLCAQLVSMNRYGVPGLGVAVAESLRALIGASRTAVSAVVARNAEVVREQRT